MNVFEIKESKMKSYLKFLYENGATSRSAGVRIDEIEKALKIDDHLFDEVTKYLAAEGLIQRYGFWKAYITKSGVNRLKTLSKR